MPMEIAPVRISRALGRFVVRMVSIMNALATGWIFFIMFLMVADVAGRAFFNHPITGTPEIVKVSLVGIIFLQMPHTFWVGRHIRSELILSRLKPPYRDFLDMAARLLVVLIFLGIFVSSWDRTLSSWTLLEFEGEGALRVPVYPIRTLILIGSILTSCLFIYRFFESAVRLIKRQDKGDD
jgi:TRAP-type C4-dicarboxylate transport system permease small subunit